MESSSFFEQKPFTPHAAEQEKNAQSLAKALRGLHMDADASLSAHGLTHIEPFSGDIDMDRENTSVEATEDTSETPNELLPEQTGASQEKEHAPLETDADQKENLENIADQGTEMPSTSPEELKAAIAQYYFELPALDVVRKKLLAKEGVDPARVEENILAACTKMQESLYENFYQEMLADAQNRFDMNIAQAQQYFALRMQNYTHDNPIYLHDHGNKQELVAENFFSQGAREAIEAIILTQKESILRPNTDLEEELPPELNMDTTLFDNADSPSSHITSDQIDAMRQRELGSIHFD